MEKANTLKFNEHFKSVFTVENNETIPNKGISLYPSLPDFEITIQGMYNILSRVHNIYTERECPTPVCPVQTHCVNGNDATLPHTLAFFRIKFTPGELAKKVLMIKDLVKYALFKPVRL